MTQVVTNLAEYQELIGSGLVAVAFCARWCGHCNKIAPIYDELADVSTDVTFLKVDVDDAAEIAENNSVASLPTFMFFKDGTLFHSFVGPSEATLREWVEKLEQ
eukprot:TRINITY_DN1112_c0_g1_i1.p1 TRINITY_DN1112_c0_g1~~TRINITY_DN1112_c0_g1_i1.p1  ORF type:complete len:122 (+),score=32.92 TRINITY_DN1112_c0_g1_i1:56-367(+)